MLEEKENEGKADVEITCSYLDKTQVVTGLIDFFIYRTVRLLNRNYVKKEMKPIPTSKR